MGFAEEILAAWDVLSQEEDDTEELTDHDEIVDALNTLNLLPRDIDALKKAVLINVESDREDMEFGAIWLSALNTYRNTHKEN